MKQLDIEAFNPFEPFQPKIMSRFIIIWILLLLAPLGVRAQQAITFCGGDGYGTSGSVSFTSGEVAVRTAEARSITVVDVTQYFTEGIQQAFVTKDLAVDRTLTVNLSIYPNPTQNGVVMECNGTDTPLFYELYNMKGQQVLNGRYEGGQQRIDMSKMTSGSYLMRVSNAEKNQYGTFKIIKTD